MMKQITILVMLLALVVSSVSAQYTSDGVYTIHCQGKKTFMSADGVPGKPLPLKDSTKFDDNCKLYVVANPTDASKINIITPDGLYVGSVHTSGYGTWIENTPANRDSSIAAAGLLEQSTNAYYIDTYLGDGTQKMWNGQRNSSTAVGMGTSGGANYTWNLTRIGDLYAPTDITLSDTAIYENNVAGAVVGTFAAVDADTVDTFTFVFEADTAAGADNDAFTINGNALAINASADYNTKSEYKVNVKVTDKLGFTFVKAFTIIVKDFAETEGFTTDGIYTIHCAGKKTFMSADGVLGKPLPLQDSTRLGDDNKLYVVENPTDSTKVNIITLDGRYVGSVHTSGYGSWIENTTANRDSSIAAAGLLEQTTNAYYIDTYLGDGTQKMWNGQRNSSTAVGMGTSGGANYTWNFTRIGDMPNGNVAPTVITLSADSITEGNATNDTIGMLVSSDANPFDTFTYSLGADGDNGSFMINNNMLTIKDTAVFATKASYDITIKVTDNGGLSLDKAFTISVIEVPSNDAPTDITLSATTIDENNAAGATVGTLSASDADANDTFTYTLESDTTSGVDNVAFTITGDVLSMNASADFETKSEFKINVKVSDAGDSSFVKAFTINVNDVNEAPTAIVLSADSLAENAAVGTLVGTLTATDADANSTFTYTLSGADSASFSVDGDALKNAESFDFETKASYSITVTVSDGALTFDKNFTITITDIVEASLGSLELSNISTYPNPVVNTLTIDGLSVDATASIYSVSGSLLQVVQVSASNNSIDFSELSSGSYILKVAVEDGELVTKIIK